MSMGNGMEQKKHNVKFRIRGIPCLFDSRCRSRSWYRSFWVTKQTVEMVLKKKVEWTLTQTEKKVEWTLTHSLGQNGF